MPDQIVAKSHPSVPSQCCGGCVLPCVIPVYTNDTQVRTIFSFTQQEEFSPGVVGVSLHYDMDHRLGRAGRMLIINCWSRRGPFPLATATSQQASHSIRTLFFVSSYDACCAPGGASDHHRTMTTRRALPGR